MAKTEKTTELVLVDPKEFGLVANQTTSIEEAFKPKRIESDSFATQYELIVKQELNAETFKQARELRLKLVKVRTGIADVHKSEKAFYLASGKFVDALKNKLTVPIEQMEEKLAEIEQYEVRLVKESKEKLKTERLELLAPYEVDVQFVSIEEMTEEQFDGFLATNKLAFETKIEQAKQAEIARIEAERKAEAELAEAKRLENERIEAQRLENEKLKAEQEKLQKEQAEKDRLAKIESDKQAKAIAEQKAIADKLAAELQAKEDAEKQKQEAEKAKIETEESERLAKEKALKNADDQTKVKAFYELFKSVEFPELNSEAGKKMSLDINARMKELKNQIISQSKGLL